MGRTCRAPLGMCCLCAATLLTPPWRKQPSTPACPVAQPKLGQYAPDHPVPAAPRKVSFLSLFSVPSLLCPSPVVCCCHLVGTQVVLPVFFSSIPPEILGNGLHLKLSSS